MSDKKLLEMKTSLSTKITVVVFWGLFIIGVSFSGVLVHYLQKELLANREITASSIAFNISRLNDLHNLSASELKHQLNSILEQHKNIKIELYQNNKLINYAEKDFSARSDDEKIIRNFRPGDETNEVEMHVVFPNFAETVQNKRKQVLISLGILLLVFGVLLKLLLERVLNMPMASLVSTAKAISTGKTGVMFNEKQNDEFGYLGRFINQAIAQMRDSQHAALQAKELAEVTLRSIGDGVVTTDENGNIVFMNPVAEKMSGYTLKMAAGKSLADIMPLVDEKADTSIIHPVHLCIKNNKPIDIDTDCVLLNIENVKIPVAVSVAPISNAGNVLGAIMIYHDISEARALQNELSYLASHDHLTGLYNRREFERELKKALMHVKRDHDQHTLCYLDIDQFKVVNDTCGHVAGDVLLKELAEYIKESLRKSDIFSRLGGDEFALLLLHCPVDQAIEIAQKLRDFIKTFEFEWEGKSFQVGVSIGVTPLSASASGSAEILATADMACYKAKEDGRNRIHVYQPDDETLQRRREEMSMISAVRKALAEDRFELFAQPIVSTLDKDNCGHYEVLIRMKDSNGEYVLPYQFLPAAERYQLMNEIDRWVVSTAIRYMADHDNKEFALAINLSGQSINDETFLSFIIAEINQYELDASRLCFEITETAAVNNLEHAITFITRLKEHNCRFALDDFGTGVSSFEYLKCLPVDYLKIDGVFIKKMEENHIDQAMVKAIFDVAEVMGMQTIAEFVENETIFQMLNNIGITYAQGYWISKPEPMSRLIT